MKPLVAGNWKMHKGPKATSEFFERFRTPCQTDEVTLLVFPPILSLTAARMAVDKGGIQVELGVQHIHSEVEGAYTGETSAEMAAEAGASYALVGHSERRQLFGESDADTRVRVAAALRAGLVPLLCVGETLEDRQAGRLEAVLRRQLDAVVASPELGESLARSETPLVLAYEPVWAIGTGETATPEDASAAHGLLRESLRAAFGDQRSRSIPILYGGSVKPGNSRELLSSPDVDGVLVGGASLDPRSFAEIAGSAC